MTQLRWILQCRLRGGNDLPGGLGSSESFTDRSSNTDRSQWIDNNRELEEIIARMRDLSLRVVHLHEVRKI